VSEESAYRWAREWERGWNEGDADAIAALYAPGCRHWTHPFRDAEDSGEYVRRVLPTESEVDARFGHPIVDGDRAAIEWWATLVEEGNEITLAGLSFVRFDEAGLVVEQHDYWAQKDGRTSPPWGT
jgi:hypothetical protein